MNKPWITSPVSRRPCVLHTPAPRELVYRQAGAATDFPSPNVHAHGGTSPLQGPSPRTNWELPKATEAQIPGPAQGEGDTTGGGRQRGRSCEQPSALSVRTGIWRERGKEKPRNRLFTAGNTLLVTRGEGVGDGEAGDGRKERTCHDGHQLTQGSAEGLCCTPETSCAIC